MNVRYVMWIAVSTMHEGLWARTGFFVPVPSCDVKFRTLRSPLWNCILELGRGVCEEEEVRFYRMHEDVDVGERGFQPQDHRD